MRKKFLLIAVLLGLFGFTFVSPVMAAPADPPIPDDPQILCPDNTSINTAIGCVPFGNQNEFIGFILGWAVGIGGGVAFLLILSASFMIITSSGNPDRLKAGQELLTSAIMGLIMIIFSIFVLRLIGVDILKIPGFS